MRAKSLMMPRSRGALRIQCATTRLFKGAEAPVGYYIKGRAAARVGQPESLPAAEHTF